MVERTLSIPRLSAWTIRHGGHEYGRYARREEAEEDARRRWPADRSFKILEVWLNPAERVINEPGCKYCGVGVPHLAGRVVANTASVVCRECAGQALGAEEPTVVESWPVEIGYVNDGGKFEIYRDAPTQESFMADYRLKDTRIEVSHWPNITAIVMSGDIGLIRLELPSDRAIDVGLRLKEILVSHAASDFARWLRGSLRDDPVRPSALFNGQATFEHDDAMSIGCHIHDDRVRLTLESAVRYILLTMELAVAFKLWRALHPMSG